MLDDFMVRAALAGACCTAGYLVARQAEALEERKADRDKPITVGAFLRQLKAIKARGHASAKQDLSANRTPVLVANRCESACDKARYVPSFF